MECATSNRKRFWGLGLWESESGERREDGRESVFEEATLLQKIQANLQVTPLSDNRGARRTVSPVFPADRLNGVNNAREMDIAGQPSAAVIAKCCQACITASEFAS
jgi:hypothetical protein